MSVPLGVFVQAPPPVRLLRHSEPDPAETSIEQSRISKQSIVVQKTFTVGSTSTLGSLFRSRDSLRTRRSSRLLIHLWPFPRSTKQSPWLLDNSQTLPCSGAELRPATSSSTDNLGPPRNTSIVKYPEFSETLLQDFSKSRTNYIATAYRTKSVTASNESHLETTWPILASSAKDSKLSSPEATPTLSSSTRRLRNSKLYQSPVMQRPPAVSSRSSTLDSNTSVPSPDQLTSRDGLNNKYASMNSSTTSLAKSGVQEPNQNDQELLYNTARSDSTVHASQFDSTSPPPPVPSQTTPTASSSSHLSGLVCNVHRTTGKEPHALVGASTTILGDYLYVFGGRRISRSRPVLTSDLYELDLLKRHWTKIEAKGDIPSPRYFHSVCTLGDNKLVCYGGMSPEPTAAGANGAPANEAPETQVSVMSDVHIYDIKSRTWIKVQSRDNPQGRYAHCAAILPSSAVFASASAPLSAIHHNPSGDQPNAGSIGATIDGTGGAEMIVVGGQDSGNNYIEQISIFNLRSLKWTSTSPTTGRSCGAYRSVVTPLTTMKASEIGAGNSKGGADIEEEEDPAHSGSPMLIYTNYNFLDVKLELQVRQVDGTLVDKPMQAAVSPPGLRFPSGGIIDNHFVVAGTFLTSSKQEFALWALDLKTLTWAKIDVASSIFSSGSWNRGILWNRRNAFVILGNRKRNLVDDYNNRRLNFSNICLVQLEAFGLYDNPRKSSLLSGYTSVSAPNESHEHKELYRGGAVLQPSASELGEQAINAREISDMEILTLDGTRIPTSSRFIARRWGAFFNMLMQEANPALAGNDTLTLRPSAASIMSRNSSVTITPSFNSGGTTLAPQSNGTGGEVPINSLADAPDARSFPSNTRPRIVYLPHTVPTVSALLHFIYTSSLPPISSPMATPQILCSLLQLARPYKIDGLLEAVVERLHESLDGRNAAAIFNAAAMGAGGGDGLDLALDVPAHPPRTASLAGIPNEAINAANGTDRGLLRIDTDMANNNPRKPNPASASADEGGETDDDDKVPNSASTTTSMASGTNMLPQQNNKKTEEEIWDGGWSAVIGLQKRGLRGLMEGRRLRERGKGVEGAAVTESSRVGLGIA